MQFRSLLIMYVSILFLACNNHKKDHGTATNEVSKNETDTNNADVGPNNPQPDPSTNSNSSDTLFKGVGTEPFWALTIIKDKEIRFTTAEGFDLAYPYVELNKSGNEYRCISTKGRANIVLKITEAKCSDGMSENEYTHEVIAVVNTVTYRGCGSFE